MGSVRHLFIVFAFALIAPAAGCATADLEGDGPGSAGKADDFNNWFAEASEVDKALWASVDDWRGTVDNIDNTFFDTMLEASAYDEPLMYAYVDWTNMTCNADDSATLEIPVGHCIVNAHAEQHVFIEDDFGTTPLTSHLTAVFWISQSYDPDDEALNTSAFLGELSQNHQ